MNRTITFSRLILLILIMFGLNTVSAQTTYYLQNANVSAASTVSSWRTDVTGGGGGTAATTFAPGNNTVNTFNTISGQSATFAANITAGSGGGAGSGIIFNIVSGSTATINTGVTITLNGKNANNSEFNVSGTVIFGATAKISLNDNDANNKFTLGAGATFKTANVLGILGTSCSIEKTAGTLPTATANITANFEFNAAANQATSGLPATLHNLTLSNSGVKTISGVTVNGVLSMEGTATISALPTYGSAATLQYNTTSARTSGVEWPTTFSGTGGVIIASTGAITMQNAKTLSSTSNVTINSGASLIGGSFTHLIAGNWTNNGTYTGTGSTINFNGTAQTIGGTSSTTFNNVTLSGSGTKTFGLATTFSGNLTISSGVVANLSTFTHSAGTLTLNVTGTPIGSHGSTTSAATFKNNTYFAATTGIVNVTTNSCAAITAVLSGATTICSGGSSNLIVTITGGNSPFTVVYSGGTVPTYTSGSAISVSPTSTTSYTLTSVTGANGCSTSGSGNPTVTVNNAPTIASISAPSALCSGGSLNPTAPTVTLNGSAISSQGWQLETAVGSGTFAGITVPYTVALADNGKKIRYTATNGCGTTNGNQVTITVNQLPAGTLTNGGTVCSGTQPQLTFTSTAGTGPFDLVINGQTYTGRTSGVAFTATGTAPTATTTYNLTNITGVNCTNTSSASTSVTVTPINTVGAASSTPTLCMDTVLTDITHTTTGATGIGSATGLPTGVTASWASNTITISGTPTASGTFNYTIPLTGGCGSVDAIGTITVSSQITWTGSVSTAWSNNANWSCGIAPGTGSDVSIGTASFYPEINSNVIINSLTLNSGTTIVVNSLYNLTVTGAIVNNGTLTIENNGNLIQVNNVANTGAGSTVVKRESNPLIRLDYMAWSSPVSGQGLLDFSPLTTITPSVRFYTYNTTTDLYNSISSGAINTEQFSTGKGYLIRLPFNHPTAQATWNGAFTGNPHNGDYSVGVSTAGNKYNLIGNPYPSPISISQFAADNNSNIETTLYFWRKTNNATSPSYCTWNTEFPPTFAGNGESYASTPNDVIRTGQGFIVQAKTGVTSVEFNNNQRIADNANQIFRNSNNSVQLSPSTVEANRIWLNLIGASSGYSQAVVGYFTNATEGVDNFDSKFFNDGPVALTTVINNQDYVIQGRSLPFLASDVVPLKYKVTNSGSYSIAIDHVDGIFANGQMVYLRDNSNGVLHDLSTGAYTFTSAAGTFASRFDIVYQMQLSTNTEIFTENQLITYTEDSNLVIQSTGDLIKTVAIFDLRGRLITSQNEVNNSIITLPLNINNQVLLVKVTSVNGVVVTKKVMF